MQHTSTATPPTASDSIRPRPTADLPQRPRTTSLPRVRIEGGSGVQIPSASRKAADSSAILRLFSAACPGPFSCLGERTRADLVRPTSLASGDVLFSMRAPGSGGVIKAAPALRCGHPVVGAAELVGSEGPDVAHSVAGAASALHAIRVRVCSLSTCRRGGALPSSAHRGSGTCTQVQPWPTWLPHRAAG